MKYKILPDKSSKNFQALVNALDKFHSQRVLVIGDIIVDEYLWGSVERISPEAPVQVVQIEKQEYRLGGCGNVVNNLCALGAEVLVVSVIGDGFHRQFVIDEFKHLGVNAKCLLIDEGRPTTKKTRVVAANQQVVRIDFETTKPISKKDENLIKEFISINIPLCDVVLLSDYSKGVVTKRVASFAISNAKEHSIPTIVDPKGRKYSKYIGTTIITPNAKEAEMASNIEIREDSSAEKAAYKILMNTKCEAVLITRGKQGMTLVEGVNKKAIHIPAQAREVFDVTGAGDTVLSVLGLAVASKLSFEEASYLANAAGGVVVGKLGTSAIKVRDLISAINTMEAPASKTKEKTCKELGALLSAIIKGRSQAVFAAGRFDILNAGHIELLQKLKELVAVVIVGIESGKSCKSQQMATSPVIHLVDQIKILSALDYVDFLTILGCGSTQRCEKSVIPGILLKPFDCYSDLDRKVLNEKLLKQLGISVFSIEVVDSN
jgi:D-beta-D-heptose 7-phosphate kinase/D-beta-D-heptose 1-phosphate adenosyltransferase